MTWTVFALAVSYLAGGMPTAIIAGKLLRGIDIRQYGSRSAGATNAWRVLGPRAGSVVLLIDAAKGVAAVLLVSRLGTVGGALDQGTIAVLCGLAAIAGHVWTPFAGFRGGKGVGTAAGVFGALAPWALLFALTCFVAVVAATRYISAGSISAAAALASAMIVQHVVAPESLPLGAVVVGVVVATLVIAKHRANVRRLLNGTENRFSFSGSAEPVAASDPAEPAAAEQPS